VWTPSPFESRRSPRETYRDLVREQVLERVGMTWSGFFAMDVVEPDVAETTDLVRARSPHVPGDRTWALWPQGP
jgi:CubicO group peptidase (beta-lactamase class C family)